MGTGFNLCMSHDHMGDLNLHLDVTLDPCAVRFQTPIESYGLLQHISSPTHRAGQILDVFYADGHSDPRSEMSDHSFITLIDCRSSVPIRGHDQLKNRIRRFKWRHFNYDKFCTDIGSYSLLCDPSHDVVGLFTCYRGTL